MSQIELRNFAVQKSGPSQIRVKLPTGQSLLTPAVAEGRVFVGGGFTSNEVYCLATDTGRPLWGVRLSDPGPSAPTYDRGTLSFTTESCSLYVLDAATGNCLWSTWLGDPLITVPTVAGDRVLVCYPASISGGRPARNRRLTSSLPPAIFARASRCGRSGSTKALFPRPWSRATTFT